MKHLFFLATLSAFFIIGKAQNISFGYDPSGNRISKNVVVLKSTSDPINDVYESNSGSGTINSLQIIIYPNPVKEILTIEIKGNETGDCHLVELFDFEGRLILSSRMPNDHFSVPFYDKAPGIYLLKIVTNGHLSEWKVIRE